MRILLAYPEFPADTFWSFERALALSGRRSTMPPLGLLTIAGGFSTDRFDLTLVDENVRPIRDEDIRAADYVLASGMVVQRTAMERLIERCRELGTPIVVGGPLVSGCFEELRSSGWSPTSWFVGEAEQLLARLVDDIERGALAPAYAHVIDDDRAERVRGVLGAESHVVVAPLPDLALAPTPRFELLELDAYHSMAIQASRGCPVGCEFCDIWTQFGKRPRTGGSPRLLEQLDYLYTLGWRGRVFVVDDNFIGNVGAAEQLLPDLERWQEQTKRFRIPQAYRAALSDRRVRRLERRFRRGRSKRFPFAFSTEADVRLGETTERMSGLREAMVAAGFSSVFLGIETPSADALREIGKRVNLRRSQDAATGLLEKVGNLQRVGLEVMSGFILGFDSDPHDIDEAMIDFIDRAGIPMAMVGLLGVLPGTALQERLVREGRFGGKLVGAQTHDFALNYEPRGRSEQQIVSQYARVLEAIYGDRMRSYYRRCAQVIGRMPSPPRTGDSLGRRELVAFALSLLRVRPLVPYWAFLLRTLLRRPKFLGLAVVLALQGEHLHRLTERRLREFRSTQRSTQPERKRLLESSFEGACA